MSNFKYIKNRIKEYNKNDILISCYEMLNKCQKENSKNFPIWSVFLLMKWTYLYGEEPYKPKNFSGEDFFKILRVVTEFNQEHASSFIKERKTDRAFLILFSQQFYLQEVVYKEVFAKQLKLFNTLKGRYDINKSFESKTKLSIFDFIVIEYLFCLYISQERFDGNINDDFLLFLIDFIGYERTNHFLNLLSFSSNEAKECIENYNKKINQLELQPLEMTFFTMYPFQRFENKIKMIHKGVYYYVCNYYIYDFLKANDEAFTTEFGGRIEKYCELGLKELNLKYKKETELKRMLPLGSKLVDFHLEEEHIFIECKAVELQPYPSVNPTDEILYNSLKENILKAYFEQLLTVSKALSYDHENWGIIITYKQLFWGDFQDLFKLAENKYEVELGSLKPENVFIININTWDKVIQIIKDKKASLIDILKLAKQNNSQFETKKQLFDMHLDVYNLKKLNLEYLKDELNQLNINNLLSEQD